MQFASNVPDTRLLPDTFWQNSSELVGLDMKPERQLQLLDTFIAGYKAGYDACPPNQSALPREFFLDNGTFGSTNAEIAYCVGRHIKPRRIIEIGSATSTCFLARAAIEDQGESALFGHWPGSIWLRRVARSGVRDEALSA